MTSCWTNNVRQFDPSHTLQSICTLSRNTFATHFDKHRNHECFVREEVSNCTVNLVNEFYEFEHLSKNIRYNLRLTTFYTTRDNALCTYLLQYLSNLIIGHEPGGGGETIAFPPSMVLTAHGASCRINKQNKISKSSEKLSTFTITTLCFLPNSRILESAKEIGQYHIIKS